VRFAVEDVMNVLLDSAFHLVERWRDFVAKQDFANLARASDYGFAVAVYGDESADVLSKSHRNPQGDLK
jgi:hypothetical protein